MSDSARLYERLLVVRCQARDRVAFEELVGLFQPRLRAFLHKMLGASHSVEDLAQEAWIEVFRDLGRLNDPGAFVPWFYRIARNRAYRAMRRRPLVMESIQADVADKADDQAEFRAEDAAIVKAAMDELSPEHREVLLLRFMEEMSYEDIALVAGCQLGTVRSRIHNAKRVLREIVERQSGYGSR
jgi:RNA polymerase sigma-70 factor, ECF subfamily